MAIPVNDNIKTYSPKLLDSRSGPYNSISECLTSLPLSIREKGLFVIILNNGDQKLFWFKNGINNSNLEEFSQSSIISETDPTVPIWVKNISINEIGYWNQAYLWGYHANFGYLTQTLANNLYIPLSQKGTSLGVVPLNDNIKIDLQYLPDNILGNLRYGGTFNGNVITASSQFSELNNQPLPTTSQYIGIYFIASASFTFQSKTYDIGDWLIHNSTGQYEKIDNSDAITSFNNRIGPIILNNNDVVTALGFTPINPNGLSAQYIKGDGSFGIFPTNISFFINDSNYLTQISANSLYALLNHTHDFNSLTNKPTTLSGYGIIDTYSKIEINSFFNGNINITGYNKQSWDYIYDTFNGYDPGNFVQKWETWNDNFNVTGDGIYHYVQGNRYFVSSPSLSFFGIGDIDAVMSSPRIIGYNNSITYEATYQYSHADTYFIGNFDESDGIELILNNNVTPFILNYKINGVSKFSFSDNGFYTSDSGGNTIYNLGDTGFYKTNSNGTTVFELSDTSFSYRDAINDAELIVSNQNMFFAGIYLSNINRTRNIIFGDYSQDLVYFGDYYNYINNNDSYGYYQVQNGANIIRANNIVLTNRNDYTKINISGDNDSIDIESPAFINIGDINYINSGTRISIDSSSNNIAVYSNNFYDAINGGVYITDSWVYSLGYITNSALTNYATLNTTQTFTATKTFNYDTFFANATSLKWGQGTTYIRGNSTINLLEFYTNNSVSGYFDVNKNLFLNGKLSINNSNPVTLIDAIDGITARLQFSQGTNEPTLSILRTNSSGFSNFYLGSTSNGIRINSSGEIRYLGSSTWYHTFYSGGEIMRINGTGVGIYNTSPIYAFDVSGTGRFSQGTGSPSLIVSNPGNSASNAVIQLNSLTGSNIQYGNYGTLAIIGGTSNVNTMNTVKLAVSGVIGQIADIQQWISGSSTLLASVGASGGAYFSGNIGLGVSLSSTTAKLDILDTTLSGSGSLSGSILNLAQTWNTTGNPNAINLVVTNTSSGAYSNLMSLTSTVGGSTWGAFYVTKEGNLIIGKNKRFSIYEVDNAQGCGYINHTARLTIDAGTYYAEKLYLNTVSNQAINTGTGLFTFGGSAIVTGTITASSIIKSGGLSTEFLKADGSIDTNTYLTTSLATSTYQPLENQRLRTTDNVQFSSIRAYDGTDGVYYFGINGKLLYTSSLTTDTNIYFRYNGVNDTPLLTPINADYYLTNYVTKGTTQTITGAKTFTPGALKLLGYDMAGSVILKYAEGSTAGVNTVSFPDAGGGTVKDVAYRDWVQAQGYLTNSALTNYVTTNTYQTISQIKFFSNGLAVKQNKKLIISGEGDEWSWFLYDASNFYGYGVSNIYATEANKHIFINGEDNSLSDIICKDGSFSGVVYSKGVQLQQTTLGAIVPGRVEYDGDFLYYSMQYGFRGRLISDIEGDTRYMKSYETNVLMNDEDITISPETIQCIISKNFTNDRSCFIPNLTNKDGFKLTFVNRSTDYKILLTKVGSYPFDIVDLMGSTINFVPPLATYTFLVIENYTTTPQLVLINYYQLSV